VDTSGEGPCLHNVSLYNTSEEFGEASIMSWMRMWKRVFTSPLSFIYIELGRLGGRVCALLQFFLTVPMDKPAGNDR